MAIYAYCNTGNAAEINRLLNIIDYVELKSTGKLTGTLDVVSRIERIFKLIFFETW